MGKTHPEKIVVVAVILFALLGAAFCKSYTSTRAEFTVVYSNDVLGETEPCGCKVNQLGGIPRKAAYVSKVRKEVGHLLLLDAGDLLFKTADFGDNPDVSLSLAGKKIIESYNSMGWTALGVGETEFALGADYLKELADTADFPFLSANIMDAKTNRCLFEPYTVVSVGRFTVGITSVIGNNVGFSASRRRELGITVADPASSLGAVLGELKGKADFIIVLAHTGTTDAEVLAREFDDIDLMIVGHSGYENRYRPTTENNTLVTTIYAGGKYLDRLDFALTDTERPRDFFVEGGGDSDSVEYRNLLLRKKQLEVFTADIEARKKKGKDVSMMEKVVSDEMEKVNKALKKFEAPEEKRHDNTVTASLIALDETFADDPAIRDIFKKYAEELARIKEDEKEASMVAGKREPAALSVEPHYVGMTSCRACHAKIYEFVAGTGHYRAYETLRKKERQFEPGCITCHTVGYKVPGGFFNVLTAKDLLGVQCETCHGPGSLHVKDAVNNKMRHLTTQTDCLVCHTPEHDGNFVYSEKLEKIRCPKQ